MALGLVHLWVTAPATNVFSAATPHTDFVAFYLGGFTKAVVNYYMGATHDSFWGVFGWMNLPLVIGTPNVDRTIRFLVQAATWGILALTLVRLEQVAARLVQVARRGHARRACQIAFSNVPVNSYFVFTVFMVALFIRTDNRFIAQGRNWIPFVLPTFWVALVYAPRTVASPAVRGLLRTGVLVGLCFYATVGSLYSIEAIKQRFYFSRKVIEQAEREPVLVRCPLEATRDLRPVLLQGSRESSFTSPVDSLEGVEVRLGTSRQTNYGTLRLSLLDNDGRTLRTSQVDAAGLRDNEYQWFPFASLTGLRAATPFGADLRAARRLGAGESSGLVAGCGGRFLRSSHLPRAGGSSAPTRREA